jgi:hypothetical protein
MLFAHIVNSIRSQQLMQVPEGGAEGRGGIFALKDCVFKAKKSSMRVPSDWQAHRKGRRNLKEIANGFRLRAWSEMERLSSAASIFAVVIFTGRILCSSSAVVRVELIGKSGSEIKSRMTGRA